MGLALFHTLSGLAVTSAPAAALPAAPPDTFVKRETPASDRPCGTHEQCLIEAAGLLKAGKPDEAAVLYDRLRVETPTDVRALAGLSRTWTERDDFERGLTLAREALDRLAAPLRTRDVSGDRIAHAEARLALGEAYFRSGALEEAGVAFRQSLAGTELAAAWYGLARYELTVPRYPAAGRALREASTLDPDDPRIVRRLASLVASRQETIDLYRHYLELPPAEGEQRYANAAAWLAVLGAVGDRKLYRLEGPAQADGLALGRIQGLPFVDVRLGDLPARPFLLDSGAGGVTVGADVARRLHLEPVGDFTVRGVSADTQVAPFILLPRLSVGPYTFHDVPAVIISGRSDLRGIIGLSLLAPLRPVLQDFRTLALEREDDGVAGSTVAGSTTTGVAPASEAPPGCPTDGWWRARNIGGMLRITARVEQQAVHLLVDTGAARSILSRAVLARIGVREAAGTSGAGIGGLTGAARNVGRVRGRGSLSFFGRQTNIRGMAVLDLTKLSHSLGSEVDGILGVDLLKGLNLAFDYGGGRLRVEASKPHGRR